jgi:hypothetical protein
MYTHYREYEVAHRRQTLLQEAEVERAIQREHVETHDKFSGKYFWYEALSLPIPFFDVLHANVSQALVYDALRRRTQSMVLMVGSAAFGLGILTGGWLNNALSLATVLTLGFIVALLACVPVVWRLLFLLKRRRVKPVLR